MIDPLRVTDFDRSRPQQEEFWLYCVLVAGKRAETAAACLDAVLADLPAGSRPFEHLASLGGLRPLLERARTGQYKRIERAFRESLRLDVTTAPLADLLRVYGVGHKTARFYLIHTRRGERYAALDTHLLRWMRIKGFDVPAATPTSTPQYERIERLCLDAIARHYPDLTCAEADLAIWKDVSGRETAA